MRVTFRYLWLFEIYEGCCCRYLLELKHLSSILNRLATEELATKGQAKAGAGKSWSAKCLKSRVRVLLAVILYDSSENR